MPHELRRIVRFCLGGSESSDRDGPPRNSFAAWPPMTGLGAHHEWEICCRGEPHAVTGYLIDITQIDRAVRECVLPVLQAAFHSDARGANDAARLLRDLLTPLNERLHQRVASVVWRLTPYHSLTMSTHAMEQVCLRQQFEFSASHRLHVPSMSAAENQRVFGKCNSANGHGHNYRVEVGAAKPVSGAFSLADLERIVDDVVIRRFDHKHLNLDTAEFATLNPTVEHITKVCHDLLREPLAKAGGELRHVTVWETSKTSCTYSVHASGT